MATTSNFFINSGGLHKWRMSLHGMETQFPRAMANALNRTLDFTFTRVMREVTNKYSIQRQDVKNTMLKHRASKTGLYAYITSKGMPLPLGKFPHTPATYNKKAKTVKVKVKKAEGYKEVKPKVDLPKPFVQDIYQWAGNKSGIFVRKGSSRFPLKSLRSSSVPQMISSPDIINNIQTASEAMLNKRIEHEVNWIMEKSLKDKSSGGTKK